jgi:general secretion pathway protein L
MKPLGSLPLDSRPDPHGRMVLERPGKETIVLVVNKPPLVREIRLPVAAQRGLNQVLDYEMDQFTPFRASEVFFSYRILEQAHGSTEIDVEIILIPKSWVQVLLDRLEALAVTPISIEVRLRDGGMHQIPIRRTDPARQARDRLLRRTVWTVTAALAVAAVAFPVVRQSLALASAEDRVAELRPKVEEAETLRRRLAAESEGASRIAALRQAAGAPLEILADLTDVIPDDTFLTSLTLRRDRLVVEGHSAAATRLIAALAAQKRLRNPSFAAPVVRSENGDQIFTIQSEVMP